MKRKFYLTTAIPYVNAPPHIGFALEIIQTDTIARYQRLLGKQVFFLTGTDENSLKTVQAAEKEGVSYEKLSDKYAARFESLKETLDLSFDNFIRTSDQKKHFPGAKKFWQKIAEKGDIYKGVYEGFYCVGCEEFKTKKDLQDGFCMEHKLKAEKVSEENYFFRLSRYKEQILKLIKSEKLKIIPESRRREVVNFIKKFPADLSISRPTERVKGWGIPVPEDSNSSMYCWVEALANYLTGIGYGRREELFKTFWPADVHVLGKGVLKFHAFYWPCFLLSAGLPLPKTIFAHGYVTVNGEKISKSLGNIVDPFALVEKYGADAIRYYLLREIPSYGDGDFSQKRFKEVYNADLANGLGNLVARVAKLAKGKQFNHLTMKPFNHESFRKYHQYMEEFRFNEVLSFIWQKISGLDRHIEKTKPWKTKNLNDIYYLSEKILEIASLLEPFLPETTSKIKKQFSGKIKTDKPLFPRIGTSYHAT